MRDYYASRAREYDAIYRKPERQADLEQLRQMLPGKLRGSKLLEIACGTGYWTQWLAPVCQSIVAQDINTEVLQLAAARLAGTTNTALICDDALTLGSLSRHFDAAFAGFWYSHLYVDQVADFLACLHSRLLPDSLVVMLDNRYVEGSSTPIARRDEYGNSWQLRTVAQTGKRYEVLKNFPDRQQFCDSLPVGVRDVEFVDMQHYWFASYRLAH
jgi:demethylmenaquinone methyltransferase/2-methoxy-6-polyprenyl-1,4-benzoquinol methylase